MAAYSKLTQVTPSSSIGSQSDYTLEGKVFGAATESDAYSAVLTNFTDFPINLAITAATYGGSVVFNFIRAAAKVDRINDGRDPPTTWACSVKYDLLGYSRQPYQSGDSSYQFKIGMQQTRMTVAKDTVHKYTATGAATAPDRKGAIAVNDGKAEGCDVNTPIYTFSETHIIDASLMTTAYKRALWQLANAPVNLYAWREYDVGEGLFLGVQGTERHKGGDWELNFEFAASPNVTDLLAGLSSNPFATAIAKGGWQFADFEFSPPDPSTSANTFVIRPRWCYIHRVYDSSDFAVMGIG